MEQSSQAVEGPLDATVVPLAPKRVSYAFASGSADWLKPGAEGRRFVALRVTARKAMGSREPGISDGAHVACARFSLLPRGTCGPGVDPRQPLTLRDEFYADHERHNLNSPTPMSHNTEDTDASP